MSGLNGVAWVFSAVLAVVFFVVGVTRAYRYEAAKKMFPWVNDLQMSVVRTIGLVEMICAVGLVVPVATGYYPWLSSAAASLLMLLMVLAIVFHARRKETDAIPQVVLLWLMLAFVAYVRMM